MKIYAAALLLAFSSPSFAAELLVHTASVHTVKAFNFTGEDQKINNLNYGIGYRSDEGYSAGYYYNSYNRHTVYITKEFMYNDHVGLVLGAATGYKEATGLPVVPVAAALFKASLTDTVGVSILAMPKFKQLAGVMHLVVSYKF